MLRNAEGAVVMLLAVLMVMKRKNHAKVQAEKKGARNGNKAVLPNSAD